MAPVTEYRFHYCVTLPLQVRSLGAVYLAVHVVGIALIIRSVWDEASITIGEQCDLVAEARIEGIEVNLVLKKGLKRVRWCRG